MKRFPPCLAVALFLLVSPLWAQRPGSVNVPGQPGGSVTGPIGRQPGIPQPSSPTVNQVYVSGRILMETGQPPAESISVSLYCGERMAQVIHTDLGGYFTFGLGMGMQSNMDFSASDANPITTGNRSGSFGSLASCEVRVSLPGYHPLMYTLADHPDMGRVEVGTLRLSRIAGVEGSAISVTSLLVPGSARKEFEKAGKDLRSNHTEPARAHLEKAVAEYDKYAAAWMELGQIYSNNHEAEKARQAFTKAIAADPQYIPPYMGLATLQLENKQFEDAVKTADKLLELDPSVGLASFVGAVGNYNLNRLDAAEKNARDAEKNSHESIPQVHALLADLFMRKQDYSNASVQMRAYLKEAPAGQFAAQMRQGLEQIEKSGAPLNDSAAPARSAR